MAFGKFGLQETAGSPKGARWLHLDRTNLINKGFIIWLLMKFCLRDTAGSPERARWLHLARSGSQSQRAELAI